MLKGGWHSTCHPRGRGNKTIASWGLPGKRLEWTAPSVGSLGLSKNQIGFLERMSHECIDLITPNLYSGRK